MICFTLLNQIFRSTWNMMGLLIFVVLVLAILYGIVLRSMQLWKSLFFNLHFNKELMNLLGTNLSFMLVKYLLNVLNANTLVILQGMVFPFILLNFISSFFSGGNCFQNLTTSENGWPWFVESCADVQQLPSNASCLNTSTTPSPVGTTTLGKRNASDEL